MSVEERNEISSEIFEGIELSKRGRSKVGAFVSSSVIARYPIEKRPANQ